MNVRASRALEKYVLTLFNKHCSTRGRILNDEMPAFSDSSFTFSSDSNSLVKPPVKRPQHTHIGLVETEDSNLIVVSFAAITVH